jgi:disulfide bond formation protein DsbB
MFMTPSKLPAQVLAGIALSCLAAVGIALTAQHAFGVKPCPWCVMQRGIFLLIALFAAVGWMVHKNRTLRQTALVLCLIGCAAGLTAAVFQHEVASQTASCAMGLADRVLTALNLEELWPTVFMVTANCAEAAAYRMLGLPYEIWSGLLYAGLGALSIMALNKR